MRWRYRPLRCKFGRHWWLQWGFLKRCELCRKVSEL